MRFAFIRQTTLPAIVTAIVVGCGSPPPPPPIHTVVDPSQSQLEPVWVNPEIVVSDTVMTLIRAERVDSIPPDPFTETPHPEPSLPFVVVRDDCIVTVTLVATESPVAHPLLIRRLDRGIYKLTLNSQFPLLETQEIRDYELVASVCGAESRRRFYR